jgi:hypothetical protein
MPWDFPKPTSRTFDSGWVTTNIAIGGWIKVVVNSSGDYDIQTFAHDSGADNIDYTISAVIMGSDKFAFTFQYSGSAEGTVAGLPFGTPRRDDPHTLDTKNNADISKHWDAILTGQMQARMDATDTIVGGIRGILGDMVKKLAEDLGAAAAAGIVALL